MMRKEDVKTTMRVKGDGSSRVGTVVANYDWEPDVQVDWDGSKPTDEPEKVDPFFLTEVAG